jgi:two-component system chemotaxis response regulator CheB
MIEVVGEASNGKEAIRLVKELKPDVITLDINMPIMDGLTALGEIKKICPECKVLMVSALTTEGARETIEALEKGAIDFITKPTDYQELFKFKDEIIGKVRAVYESGEKVRRKMAPAPPKKEIKGEFNIPPVIALGISTGGPQTLSVVLPKLPKDFPSPILIAIHMPDTFTATFAKHLDAMCQLPVKEAQEGEVIKPGQIYVSRGRIHLKLRGTPERAYVTYVQDDAYIYKPSADLLLSSAAQVYGKNTIGVIMTGMGNDGSRGIVEVKRAGGITVVEDPKSAILWAMPESAIKTGCVDYVVPKEKMAELLIKLTSRVRATNS